MSSDYPFSLFLDILLQHPWRFSSKTLHGPISNAGGYCKWLSFQSYFSFSWICRVDHPCIIPFLALLHSRINRYIISNICMIYRNEKGHLLHKKKIIFLCKPYRELIIPSMNIYILTKCISSYGFLLLTHQHLRLTYLVYSGCQSYALSWQQFNWSRLWISILVRV